MTKVYFDPSTRTYSDRPPEIADSALKPNLPDQPFLGPSTVFASANAAAIDALYYCRTRKPQFIEYGGWIVRLPGGGFTYAEISDSKTCAKYSKPVAPGSVCLGDPPDGAVASFHTHPRRGEESLVAGSQEYFSEGDHNAARWTRDQGITPGYLYLHTPYGRVRRYDPVNNVSVTVRGPTLPREGHSGD